MKVRYSFATLLSVGVICVAAFVGCGEQSEAPESEGAGQQEHRHSHGGAANEAVDPHDLPLTDEQKQQLREETAKFADAVGRISQLRDTVCEETSDGLPEDPFEAHQALDKLDLVVQWLPEIARASGVPKERWAAVNTAAKDLRELFEKVHQNIDNKADPDFLSVAAQIDQRIGELEVIAQAQPASE
jgi:hypothetical protein